MRPDHPENSPEAPPIPEPGGTSHRLLFLLGDRRGMIAVLAAASLISGLTESGILAVLAQTATALVSKASEVHFALGPLNLHATVGALLAIAVGLAIVRLIVQVPVSLIPAQIAATIQGRLRMELFTAYTRASWSVQSADREGHFQETITNQIGEATAGALQATTLVSSLLTFVVLIISAFALNIVAALVVLVAAIALFGLLRPLSSVGARRAAELSRAYLEYAGAISESVRVAEETRVFGAAAAQRTRIGSFIATARDLFFRTQALIRGVPALYQSLIYLLVVGGLAILYLAHSGHITSLGAVVLLLVRAGTYGQQAQGAYQGVRQALPYVDRLEAVQRSYADSTPPEGTAPLDEVHTVTFDDVSYAYQPGRLVLRGVSFEVGRGEAIGIVGPSGAGKSTLVQILLGLRPPVSGRYLVNGIPAADVRRADWDQRMSFVPQDPKLLHASVADNIRYFRQLDDHAVERAARLAAIHDDIARWPKGYETIVGPRADAVSGGQRQRICLARALAARPDVLVLDEPTSALDPHSEALIQESLAGLRGELTLFVIAHRMSTLDICERVMVILDGQLEAFDSSELLHGTSPYYRSTSELVAGWTTRS
jgi:ABC-type multidrug transport system fused ATPase/permease subunit